MKKGKISRAHSVLKRVRQGSSEGDVKTEIAEIESTLEDTNSFREMINGFFNWRVFER